MDHPLQQQQHHHHDQYQRHQQQQQVLQRSSSMPLPEARRQHPQHHLQPPQYHQYPPQPPPHAHHYHPQLQEHMHHSQSQQPHNYQQQQQQQQHLNVQSMTHHHPPSSTTSVAVGGSNYNNNNALSSSTSSSSSSRAKCDQVIYEAIAKVCEIAVRGRCTTTADEDVNVAIGGGGSGGYSYEPKRNLNYNKSYSYGGGGGGGGGTSSSSNRGRFNIEVDEVPSIRNSPTLSSWRELYSTSNLQFHHQHSTQKQQPQPPPLQSSSSRAVHVPLRLDIYYEYYNYDISTNDTAHSQQPPPQRELLERWCIDYYILPQSSTSPFSSSSSTSSSHVHQHQQSQHHNRSSSSPYTSPTSSPYSSIIMTGARPSSSTSEKSAIAAMTNTTATATTTTTSQLRRVCRRIVVLLRSLHCMTRMLPAYRLRCLLLANSARRDYGNGGRNVVGAGGWGTIGHSLHIAAASTSSSGSDGPEPLPSPSFAVRSFPIVPTPYGHLSLSVMFDATLDPQRMIDDVAERRGEWMVMMMRRQQQLVWEQQQQQQQQHQPAYQEQYQYGASPPLPPEMLPTYSTITTTPHIPIATHPQDDGRFHHLQQQPNGMSLGGGGRDQPMSCPQNIMPPTTLLVAPSSLGGVRSRAVSDFIISDYHSATPPPPQHRHHPLPTPSFSSSLKFSPTLKSIGNNNIVEGGIIGDHDGNGGKAAENKRVMSGLSLAMMNETANAINNNVVHKAPEHRRANSANEYGQRYVVGEDGPGENVNDELVVIPFGSPATRRAAFHTPPPPLLSETPGGGVDSGTHFFHRHGGYGYGYNNGSNLQFGTEQKHWDEPNILPPPSLLPQPRPTVVTSSDGPRSYLSHDASRLMSTTPPANRVMKSTSLQPSVSATPHFERSGSGTPPAVAHWNRSPLVSSPTYNQHQHQSASPSGVQLRPTPSISLSMSVQQSILPPITSLDVLQKSPFNIAQRRRTASTSGKESTLREGDEGGPRQDAEMMMFLSSIPRMVPSASGERSDCNVAVSTLGDDPPSIPMIPPSAGSGAVDASGECTSSNGPHGSGGCTVNDNNSACRKSFLPQAESDHLPFAADDDDALLAVAPTLSSSPAKSSVGGNTSRSLWGSTKADMLDGTLGGGGMAEIATSLAVSSLHHRCATDGKIRLKMFEGAKSTIVEGDRGFGLKSAMPSTNSDACGDPSFDYATIQDRLSDFRSFGASLMISSTHHEESK